MTGSQAPSIGRIVLYQAQSGSQAALVTAVDGAVPDGLPALSGSDHVHLTVFGCGSPGSVMWNVPLSTFNQRLKGAIGSHRVGTWRWPERV